MSDVASLFMFAAVLAVIVGGGLWVRGAARRLDKVTKSVGARMERDPYFAALVIGGLLIAGVAAWAISNAGPSPQDFRLPPSP